MCGGSFGMGRGEGFQTCDLFPANDVLDALGCLDSLNRSTPKFATLGESESLHDQSNNIGACLSHEGHNAIITYPFANIDG